MHLLLLLALAAHASPTDAVLGASLAAAVKGCGVLSPSTVPMSWGFSPVSDRGCTIRVPPGWATGNLPGLFKAVSDPTESTGFLWLVGYLPGAHWTPASISDYVVSEVRKGTPDVRVFDSSQTAVPYGLGVVRTNLVRYTRNGVEGVGNVRVTWMPCSPLVGNCPLLATVMWQPVAQVGPATCILAQLDAALQCPRAGAGSSCSEADCDAACKGQGYTDGACTNDTCTCQ